MEHQSAKKAYLSTKIRVHEAPQPDNNGLKVMMLLSDIRIISMQPTNENLDKVSWSSWV